MFRSDQIRVVYYLGAYWFLNARYPDYGPNILVIRPYIARKWVR